MLYSIKFIGKISFAIDFGSSIFIELFFSTKTFFTPLSSILISNVPSIEKITIPLPSLEIQERYANVLDNFESVCNDLKIGLPAEIEARQKQYEYYRDKLLTFKEKRHNNE